jgi:hypothetical protein
MRHSPQLTRGAARLIAISLFVALLSTAVVPLFDVVAAPLGATSPTLGAAASYSVLAGQTVTNTGLTRMPGDLGVSPGTAVTGFPPGIVGPPGTIHAGDAAAAAAQSANTAAFTFLDQGCDITYPGTKDLVGEALIPGVYCADAFRLSGTLTLSGSGVWIFKSASDLTTSGVATVVGGDPCNVWWREVSSATLSGNAALIGNILASTSITLVAGARLNGRAFAQTGSVTLDRNTITGPVCAAANTPIPTPTNTPVVGATNTAVVGATNTAVVGATTTPVAGATTTPVAGATTTPILATDTPLPPPRDTPRPPPRDTRVPPAQDTPGPGIPETATPGIPETATPGIPETATPGIPETATPGIPETATPEIVTGPPVSLPPTGTDAPGREAVLLTAVLAAWVVGAIALDLSARSRRRE